MIIRNLAHVQTFDEKFFLVDNVSSIIPLSAAILKICLQVQTCCLTIN